MTTTAAATALPLTIQEQPLVLTYIENTYKSICFSVEWLDRKFVDLTQAIFQNNSLAAIVRVATKSFAALAAFYILPMPLWITYPLLALAQMAFCGQNSSPLLAQVGTYLDGFISSISLSSPIVRAFTIDRFSPTSIVLHALESVVTAIGLQTLLPTLYANEVAKSTPPEAQPTTLGSVSS